MTQDDDLPRPGRAGDDLDGTVVTAALELLEGRDPIPFEQLVAELRAGGHLDHLDDTVLDDPVTAAAAVQEILDRHQIPDAENAGASGGVDDPAGSRREQIRSERERRFGFDECCEAPYQLVEDAWHEMIRDGDAVLDDDRQREIAEALTHSAVPLAFAAHATELHADGGEHLARLADLLASLEGTEAAPGLLLQALVTEDNGELLEAERLLEEAVEADGSFEAAKFVLSRFTAERGDIERTLRLLTESNQGNEPYLDFLHSLVAPPTRVGRNDPCPCGSGRKYKQCCLRQTRIPDWKRAAWLQRRMSQFLVTRHGGDLRAVVAAAAENFATDDPNAARSLTGDPFLIAATMHHMGLVEDYLADRADLLDEVDRRLLESWSGARYRIYQVSSVVPGESFVLGDPLGGDSVTVTSAPGSPDPSADACMLAVVGAVGDAQRLIAPAIALPAESRDELLDLFRDSDLPAETLARWYGSARAEAYQAESSPVDHGGEPGDPS